MVGGDGSEYPKDDKTRTKIMALHSSSALVCNVFEYWRFRDKTPLARAMGYRNNIKSMVYEQKLSMGMQGSKPNLDVFCVMDNGRAVAIESKYTEWMIPKTKKELFAKSYFKKGIRRWTDVGLSECQKLAEDLHENPSKFIYLNAAQLLKHALGLGNTHGTSSALLYLYYDLPSTEIGSKHNKEIKKFRKMISRELDFKAITYQNLFDRMNKDSPDLDVKYLNYLEMRYL